MVLAGCNTGAPGKRELGGAIRALAVLALAQDSERGQVPSKRGSRSRARPGLAMWYVWAIKTPLVLCWQLGVGGAFGVPRKGSESIQTLLSTAWRTLTLNARTATIS